MSTGKRTYAELTKPSSSSQQTPSRPIYAPSTPHAIRALQERSGAKKRSAGRSTRKTTLKNNDLPRPDSARGILRRLAQLTAKTTKRRVVTPAGKENAPVVEGNEEEQDALKKPALTLPIDEEGEEDDSELPTAPTPSFLPDGDDYDPTMTFKAIDFARATNARPSSERIDRRVSRLSFPDTDAEANEDEEGEVTADITAEIGRRAMSEAPPTERLLRGSFGSIRMSDFGTELEVRRESDTQKGKQSDQFGHFDDGIDVENDDDVTREMDAETENLRRLQRSPSRFSENDASMQNPALGDDEDTFRLDLPDERQGYAANGDEDWQRRMLQAAAHGYFTENSSDADDTDAEIEPEIGRSPLFVPQSPSQSRKQTFLETAAAKAPGRARKRLKMTRHGHAIPSLPSSLIKRIATETQTRIGKRKPKLGREHVKALEQATEWFFEQVGEDLETYSGHARRKKRVDESDVLMLMRRQRVCREEGELQTLVDEWLTKEVAAELDLPDKL